MPKYVSVHYKQTLNKYIKRNEIKYMLIILLKLLTFCRFFYNLIFLKEKLKKSKEPLRRIQTNTLNKTKNIE